MKNKQILNSNLIAKVLMDKFLQIILFLTGAILVYFMEYKESFELTIWPEYIIFYLAIFLLIIICIFGASAVITKKDRRDKLRVWLVKTTVKAIISFLTVFLMFISLNYVFEVLLSFIINELLGKVISFVIALFIGTYILFKFKLLDRIDSYIDGL
jgi:hypothetical protein